MTDRLRKTALTALAVLAVGGLYAWVHSAYGFSIPCLFRKITGLDCPGCGVSRMLMALLRLDFSAAFRANRVLFCMLPVLAFAFGRMIWIYVRDGFVRDRLSTVLCWICVGVLLCWGVVRNIVGM